MKNCGTCKWWDRFNGDAVNIAGAYRAAECLNSKAGAIQPTLDIDGENCKEYFPDGDSNAK